MSLLGLRGGKYEWEGAVVVAVFGVKESKVLFVTSWPHGLVKLWKKQILIKGREQETCASRSTLFVTV
jgi:hypothetical protein